MPLPTTKSDVVLFLLLNLPKAAWVTSTEPEAIVLLPAAKEYMPQVIEPLPWA